jgi:16S rRNA (uracil1498-N3)-methyltransferase
MNIVLLLNEDFIDDNRVTINDHRSRHIIEVQRKNEGDLVKIGQLNGSVGTGTITKIASSIIQLTVNLDTPPPPPLPLTLIIALPRPKMIKRILQTCATMGAKNIIFLNSYRVEKSYWQTPLLHEEKIQEQLLLGLEQGKDTLLPTVTLEKRFKPFVEDKLPILCENSMGLIAHPHSEQPCPTQVTQQTTLVIGPEGGFIPYEVEKIQAAGCQGITLGQRILRVETAIPVLLGKLF